MSTTLDNVRILAAGHTVPNDTRVTRLNNNDLVVGPSGAGKTRNYVKPNLLQCTESVVVTDTKGSLVREVGPVLARHGYRVMAIDFTDLDEWSGAAPLPGCVERVGYNPLDFVRKNPSEGTFCQQDVMRITSALFPVETKDDPFWERMAAEYAQTLISYTLEALEPKEQTLASVVRLSSEVDTGVADILLGELVASRPSCWTARKWQVIKSLRKSEKTHACICGFLAEHLGPLDFEGAAELFEAERRIDFAGLGHERCALFLTVSDTDRSMDGLVGLFYAQALQELCRHADKACDGGRLPIPVRLYLDDFATNCVIADFDNIISVIRSRGVEVSVILQNLTQLEAIYGTARASTIANNCDHWLYLGGQDVGTARQVSVKAGRTLDTVMAMPLDRVYLFERGRKGELVVPYALEEHPLWRETPEAASAVRQGRASEPKCTPEPGLAAQPMGVSGQGNAPVPYPMYAPAA